MQHNYPNGLPDQHELGWNLGHMAGQQEGYAKGQTDARRALLNDIDAKIGEIMTRDRSPLTFTPEARVLLYWQELGDFIAELRGGDGGE